MECNRIQKKYSPKLFQRVAETKDPRHPSYIKHTNKVMFGTAHYKGIAGIRSMQMINDRFNNPCVAGNIGSFLGEQVTDYLPHSVTINEYLKRLDPLELQEIINVRRDIMTKEQNQKPSITTVMYWKQRLFSIKSLLSVLAFKFIENNGEDAINKMKMSEEERKQIVIQKHLQDLR